MLQSLLYCTRVDNGRIVQSVNRLNGKKITSYLRVDDPKCCILTVLDYSITWWIIKIRLTTKCCHSITVTEHLTVQKRDIHPQSESMKYLCRHLSNWWLHDYINFQITLDWVPMYVHRRRTLPHSADISTEWLKATEKKSSRPISIIRIPNALSR